AAQLLRSEPLSHVRQPRPGPGRKELPREQRSSSAPSRCRTCDSAPPWAGKEGAATRAAQLLRSEPLSHVRQRPALCREGRSCHASSAAPPLRAAWEPTHTPRMAPAKEAPHEQLLGSSRCRTCDSTAPGTPGKEAAAHA